MIGLDIAGIAAKLGVAADNATAIPQLAAEIGPGRRRPRTRCRPRWSSAGWAGASGWSG